MRVITKNGWYGPNCLLVARQEPWTTPQDIADDLFDILPSKMVIVVPPAGYKFRDGVTAQDFPTKKDVVPMGEGDEAPEADPEAPEHPSPTSQAEEVKRRLERASQGRSRASAIRDAIGKIPTGNPKLWTSDGSPAVSAIEDILGYDITGAERDEAWEAVNAGQ